MTSDPVVHVIDDDDAARDVAHVPARYGRVSWSTPTNPPRLSSMPSLPLKPAASSPT